jgi:hypothetical protein
MSVTVSASPTQLSWSDFAPVDALPDGSGEDAQTAGTMDPISGIQPVQSKGAFVLPDLTLNVGLDRTQTLVVKTANKTDDLLKHEQGHYDITVLTIRALAKELEQMTAGSPPALGRQLNAAMNKHQQRADMLEKRYDTDTKGSRDEDKQKSWNDAIDAAMRGSNVMTLKAMPL